MVFLSERQRDRADRERHTRRNLDRPTTGIVGKPHEHARLLRVNPPVEDEGFVSNGLEAPKMILDLFALLSFYAHLGRFFSVASRDLDRLAGLELHRTQL